MSKKVLKGIALSIAMLTIAVIAYVYQLAVVWGGDKKAEGIVSKVYTDSLIKAVPVAIDVGPRGNIFIAETGKFSQGIGSNWDHPFMLHDDLESTSIDDRIQFLKKWIDRGKFSENWFTDVSDYVTD
jgi:hypothetical protein